MITERVIRSEDISLVTLNSWYYDEYVGFTFQVYYDGIVAITSIFQYQLTTAEV